MDRARYRAEYAHLCQVLRTLRREAGLTQVDVAGRLDVPQSWVSKYESGERRLDIVELQYVAAALGLTVWDVLTRLGPGWRP